MDNVPHLDAFPFEIVHLISLFCDFYFTHCIKITSQSTQSKIPLVFNENELLTTNLSCQMQKIYNRLEKPYCKGNLKDVDNDDEYIHLLTLE